MIQEALASGYRAHGLAQTAVLSLRGQRDQIVNTVGMVREIGMDLWRSDKLAKDIHRRKFCNLVILYMIIILLFITNVLVIYFKMRF